MQCILFQRPNLVRLTTPPRCLHSVHTKIKYSSASLERFSFCLVVRLAVENPQDGKEEVDDVEI